jgi:patatin-related protein
VTADGAADREAAGRRPELRLAVAMRGGVSLAVWMGGAVSEIDSLRRAQREGEQDSLYRRLLDACGYGSVAVDVVAGASAGGLNGALLGACVVHDTPFDSRVRDLWLRLGDIACLVRPLRSVQPPSLLDGDGRFYAPLLTALEQLIARPRRSPRQSKTPRLDLVLTGTLVEPRGWVSYQDLGPHLVEKRHRARFRFRHLPRRAGLLSDFGTADGDAGRTAALQRLAYAARSTSSFPGAFEPASIGFTPGATAPTAPPAPPETHFGIYSESRKVETDHDRPAESRSRDSVIDGGVLDNIPVAWALRSVAAAAADRDIARWLVYLQPVPFRPPRPRTAGRRIGLLTAVRLARRLSNETEALADDLAELARHQTDALRREGFRQVLEHALGELAGEEPGELLHRITVRSLLGAATYRTRQGAVEGNRIRSLWSDPLPTFGADTYGFRGAGGEPLEQQPLHNREPRELLRRLRGPQAAAAVLAESDVVAAAEVGTSGTPQEQRDCLADLARRIRTPQTLARTVSVLLESAREVRTETGYDVKRQLYDLRDEIEDLLARSDRLLAAEPPLDETEDAPLELVRRAAWRLLGRKPPPGGAWPQDPFADCWESLVSMGRRLGDAAGSSGHPRPAALGCLVSAAAAEPDAPGSVAALLAAVEVFTGPLRPDPLTETTPVRFHMLSAANVSPLAELLGRNGKPLGVDDKLAGNQAANFGAFFSARWRLNDWTWGRLDAARSLVEIVTDPSGTGSAGDTDSGSLVRSVDEAALARLAGLPQSAPRGEVVERLVALLHEQILRDELPVFEGLGHAAPAGSAPMPGPLPPEAPLPDTAPLREAGTATLGALLWHNGSRMRVVVRLGLVGLRGLLRF